MSSVKALSLFATLLLAAPPVFAVDYDSKAELFCDKNKDLCTYMVITLRLNTLCNIYEDGLLTQERLAQYVERTLQDVALADGLGAEQALSAVRTKYSCSRIEGLEELLPQN